MSNVRNRSRTVAIKVCLSFNFAVVFILMYFRRVKQNFYSMSPQLGKTRRTVNLHGELKKSVEELRMGVPALRQYIDATTHLAPIGNGVKIS